MSKGLEALCYLDDIAHGRKMDLDPHELKLIIEKELKALEIILKYFDNMMFIDSLDSLPEKTYKKYKEDFDLLKEVIENYETKNSKKIS